MPKKTPDLLAPNEANCKIEVPGDSRVEATDRCARVVVEEKIEEDEINDRR